MLGDAAGSLILYQVGEDVVSPKPEEFSRFEDTVRKQLTPIM